MSEKRSGPGWEVRGRQENVSTTLTEQDSAGRRQVDADSLFGADIGSYGSVNYRLPGDPEPDGRERRQAGLVAAWKHAGTAWREAALKAVEELAEAGKPFVAD